MDIKSLLEEYAVIMDDMEAESGLNTVVEPEKDEKKKEEKNESVNEEKQYRYVLYDKETGEDIDDGELSYSTKALAMDGRIERAELVGCKPSEIGIRKEEGEAFIESTDLAEKPADIEKAEYKDMKIKKPEVDTVASKLLKQCEDLEESWEPYEVIYNKENNKYFIAKDTGADYNEWRNGDTDEIIYYDTKEEAQKDCDELNKDFEQVNTDESLTEEFKGETFKHYSKFNKCKDVKEIKDLIKTIRDDIKDEDDKDKKAELKDDLAKAKNLLKMAQDLKKNESKMNEVDLATAQKVNDIRNYDAVKKTIDMKKSDDPADREIAKEAKKKAEKSNKLFRKWKKAKGIEESKKVGE